MLPGPAGHTPAVVNRIATALAAAGVSLTACSYHGNEPSPAPAPRLATVRGPLIRVVSQAEAKSVPLGISRAALRRRFGPPYKVLHDLNGRRPGRVPCWLYWSPPDYEYFCFHGRALAKVTRSEHGS